MAAGIIEADPSVVYAHHLGSPYYVIFDVYLYDIVAYSSFGIRAPIFFGQLVKTVSHEQSERLGIPDRIQPEMNIKRIVIRRFIN